MPKTLSYLSESIKTLEKIRVSIGESEYYKIGFADQHVQPYRLMAAVLLKLGDINRALSISELGRARSLAELMASQYSIQHLPGFDPDRWIDFENIVRKKSCTCLSFFFFEEHLLSWILKANRKVMFREVETKGSSTDILTQGLSILDWLEKLKFQLLLQGERCEDRSLFVWDEARSPSHVEESPAVGQVTEQEKEVVKEPSARKALLGCQIFSCNYCIMDNVEEILQVFFIGIAVASVLFQTYRYSKAIELFSECLVLLKKHSTKLKKEKLKELHALVYRRLFNLYCLVGDHKNAIQSGEKAFPLYHLIGDNESAAGLLDKIGDVYQSTGEQVKAKESYQKALILYCNEVDKVSEMPFVKQREHFERMLSVATKIGDKGIVGGLLNKLGDLSLSLSNTLKLRTIIKENLQSGKKLVIERMKDKHLPSLEKCIGKWKNMNRQNNIMKRRWLFWRKLVR
ncbi:hypothetical protein OS493_027945 [Desmophyllum pertusum]|uniref:Tetratricopeptide repeat protein n=1 Tax=Desmophyllum pertusum TaxID=174260 RepID=A0A9W9Y9D9_9CNID|nr:hypothetical protein OS493_027945 [Desmophyllum pertusum]